MQRSRALSWLSAESLLFAVASFAPAPWLSPHVAINSKGVGPGAARSCPKLAGWVVGDHGHNGKVCVSPAWGVPSWLLESPWKGPPKWGLIWQSGSCPRVGCSHLLHVPTLVPTPVHITCTHSPGDARTPKPGTAHPIHVGFRAKADPGTAQLVALSLCATRTPAQGLLLPSHCQLALNPLSLTRLNDPVPAPCQAAPWLGSSLAPTCCRAHRAASRCPRPGADFPRRGKRKAAYK